LGVFKFCSCSCCSRRTPRTRCVFANATFTGGRATARSHKYRSRGVVLSCHVRWHMRGGIRVPCHACAPQQREQQSRFPNCLFVPRSAFSENTLDHHRYGDGCVARCAPPRRRGGVSISEPAAASSPTTPPRRRQVKKEYKREMCPGGGVPVKRACGAPPRPAHHHRERRRKNLRRASVGGASVVPPLLYLDIFRASGLA
jgi:hypothetical protein